LNSSCLYSGYKMSIKIVSITKKWWVLALVITLAVFLTSCSKRKRTTSQAFGFQQCDGTLGFYDLYVAPTNGSTSLYGVAIIPVPGAVNPGDIVTVAVVNSQTLQYKVMSTQVVVNPDVEIYLGELSKAEVLNFDRFVIQPYEPGVRFDQSQSSQFTSCNLPQSPA